MGVDTGDTHTITVQPTNGACGVRDAAQGYSAEPGGSQYTIYTCAKMTRSPDGGLIVRGCGEEGDLVIPPMSAPTAPVPPGPTPTAPLG